MQSSKLTLHVRTKAIDLIVLMLLLSLSNDRMLVIVFVRGRKIERRRVMTQVHKAEY